MGSDNAKNVISDLSEIFFDELIVTESNESSLYEKLKMILGKIAEKLEKPLYIIVDELDRCRPSFALETLEKIKHIFQIKKFKFILVYNKYVLEAMIEKTYGISNDNNYLEKFVQKSFLFDNGNYFTNWFLDEVQNVKENMPKYNDKLSELEMHHIFTDLKYSSGLSLRNFKTLIANIYSYKNISRDGHEWDKVFLIIIAVEVLKIIDDKKYNELKKYVENDGQLNIDNVDHKVFFTLLKTVKVMQINPNYQELNEIFKNIIWNKYT